MELRSGGKIRVKTGCITCRIRKVKCGEEKPSCVRCVKTGRKCDGYSKPPSQDLVKRPCQAPSGHPIPGIPSLSLGPSIFDDDQQHQFFAFFVSCTSAVSTVYYRSDFWTVRVLQLSLSEPAIKYALCSLSALHRMFLESNKAGSDEAVATYQRYSLRQYNYAVRCTHKLLSDSSSGELGLLIKGLVACVLFVCYENLVGNYKTGQMHLQNGLRILSGYSIEQHSPLLDDIVHVLNRLDLQAMAFADSQAPYPFHLSQSSPELCKLRPLTSFQDATDFLINIFRYIFQLATSCEPNFVPQEKLDAISVTVGQWGLEFAHLIGCSTKSDLNAITLLRMYYAIVNILVDTKIYGNELLHDNYTTRFECIVRLGQRLIGHGRFDGGYSDDHIFSFETGIIFPLYFTAIKCRDPLIRRGAVALLSTANHQEGSWVSMGAAKVAEFVIAIEEEGIPLGGGASHILESSRVQVTNVSVNIERRQIDVMCILNSGCGENPWVVREGRVLY